MLGWPFADQSDTEQRRGAIPAAGKRGTMNREYRIEDLTEEEAVYIGEKINEIVPREVGADEEKFVFKVENENGEIVGGCIAEAYEYHISSRVSVDSVWRRVRRVRAFSGSPGKYNAIRHIPLWKSLPPSVCRIPPPIPLIIWKALA